MTFARDGEENVLNAGIFVLHFAAEFLGRIHDRAKIGAQVNLLAGIALNRREFLEKSVDSAAQRARVSTELGKDRACDTLRLLQELVEEMQAAQFGVTAIVGKVLRFLKRFLQFERELIRIHGEGRGS